MTRFSRMIGAAVSAAMFLSLSGCQNAKPEANAYTGLMCDRGNIPPACREIRPSVRSNAPAAMPAAADFETIGGDNAFAGDGTLLLEQPAPAVEAPEEAAPVAEAPAAGLRVLPEVPGGDTVPVLTPGVSAAAGVSAEGNVYVVKQGDIFSKIAVAHGVKTADLKAANPQVKDFDKIIVGQKLNIPAGGKAAAGDGAAVSVKASSAREAIPADGKYSVRSGDSLSRIAKRFGLKSSDIRVWNNLDSDKLQIGQELLLVAPAVPAVPEVAPVPEALPAAPEAVPAEGAPAEAVPVVGEIPALDDGVSAEAAPAAPVVNEAPEQSTFPCQVVAGDTLESLAATYETTVEAILEENPQIKSNADLKDGMDIIMKVK